MKLVIEGGSVFLAGGGDLDWREQKTEKRGLILAIMQQLGLNRENMKKIGDLIRRASEGVTRYVQGINKKYNSLHPRELKKITGEVGSFFMQEIQHMWDKMKGNQDNKVKKVFKVIMLVGSTILKILITGSLKVIQQTIRGPWRLIVSLFQKAKSLFEKNEKRPLQHEHHPENQSSFTTFNWEEQTIDHQYRQLLKGLHDEIGTGDEYFVNGQAKTKEQFAKELDEKHSNIGKLLKKETYMFRGEEIPKREFEKVLHIIMTRKSFLDNTIKEHIPGSVIIADIVGENPSLITDKFVDTLLLLFPTDKELTEMQGLNESIKGKYPGLTEAPDAIIQFTEKIQQRKRELFSRPLPTPLSRGHRRRQGKSRNKR